MLCFNGSLDRETPLQSGACSAEPLAPAGRSYLSAAQAAPGRACQDAADGGLRMRSARRRAVSVHRSISCADDTVSREQQQWMDKLQFAYLVAA